MPGTIYINGKFLSKPVTGVQRYALEVLRCMDALLQEDAYRSLRMVCLAPPGEYPLPGWANIELRPVGVNRDNIWEQIDLPFYARGRLLFSPCNTGPLFYSNQAITFHDAAIFGVPDAYSRAFRARYALTFHVLARISRLVLTDSLFSQAELSRHLGLPPGRFKVILLGGDHLKEVQADASILERERLSRGAYFLSVASQSAHKNFASVLRVADRFSSTARFAAAGGSFKRVFQQTEARPVPPNVHLLGYVNDRELKALYENALGFIFPSTYEGFGLPVLEAMNCGCPVLCSRAASLQEVGGEAALYFDPLDVDDLAAAVQNFLTNPHLADDLRSAGLKQASAFPWEKTARETLTALAACL
jgi:glycosyltransferase involved in cell wall biosynthesis